MCRTQAEGGTRCATHTRDPYITAYGAVLNAKGTPTMDQVRALERAGMNYASTTEGAERLKEDIAAAEIRSQWENAAILRSVLQRGIAARSASLDIARAVGAGTAANKTAPSKPVPGGGPMRAAMNWSAEDPIWPKRETVDSVLAPIQSALMFPDMARQAYRVLYRNAWQNKFVRNGRAITPASNDEGWRWRREATEETAELIGTAKPVKVSVLKPGMKIFNGIGLRTLKEIQVTDQVVAARGGEAKKVKLMALHYTDGWVDNQVAADNVYLRFPTLEK